MLDPWVGWKVLLEVRKEGVVVYQETDRGSPDVNLSPVADVLELLADQGWRPAAVSRATLCRLWEQMADLAADSKTRRHLLVEALQAAEGADEARRVRQALADLEGWGSGPTAESRMMEVDPAAS